MARKGRGSYSRRDGSPREKRRKRYQLMAGPGQDRQKALRRMRKGIAGSG